jgi:hypothetical protein
MWLTSLSIPLLIKEREARNRMKFCILFNPHFIELNLGVRVVEK